MTLVDTVLPVQLIEIKSKYNAEFRRVAIYASFLPTFDTFSSFFLNLHHLGSELSNGGANGDSGQSLEPPIEFFYNDPSDKELLPINNDTNYLRVSIAVGKAASLVDNQNIKYFS